MKRQPDGRTTSEIIFSYLRYGEHMTTAPPPPPPPPPTTKKNEKKRKKKQKQKTFNQ